MSERTDMREYKLWAQARYRTTTATAADYAYYGGKGITMCDKWKYSFDAFLADVGLAPSPKHTLERIDNERGYEEGNIMWATRAEQARNRSTTKLSIEKVREIRALAGQYTQKELGRLFNMHPSAIGRVINRLRWAEV